MTLFPALLLLWSFSPGDASSNEHVTFVKTYQNPADLTNEEEYIGRPWVVECGPNGKLFMLDRDRTRILVWGKDGKFLRGFGSPGAGPGEMRTPNALAVSADEVWVWETIQVASIFDHAGKFIRQVKAGGTNPRMFAVMDDWVLCGNMQQARDGLNYSFSKVSFAGKKLAVIQDLPTEAWLSNYEGSNDVTVKAFAPDIDINRDDKGEVYIGMSETSTLFKLAKDGSIARKIKFDIPALDATDDEKDLVNSMSFPMPGKGGRFTLKSVGLNHINFDFPKAYYTHFLIKGNHVAFVLTPVGSLGLANVPGSISVARHRV